MSGYEYKKDMVWCRVIGVFVSRDRFGGTGCKRV